MEKRKPDIAAVGALAGVALVALAMAWGLPWWEMAARAPQYGQRTLVVRVGPTSVTGDVLEVDTLGHYVGIQPIATIAPIERRLAPLGWIAAFGGLLLAPFLSKRRLRLLAVLPTLVLPLFFLADLDHWMQKTMNDRNPDAALNLTIKAIDAKVIGAYDIGQFKVVVGLGGGLYLAAVAGLLGLGLLFAVPLPLPRWRRKRAAAATAVSAGALALALSNPVAARVIEADATVAAALAIAEDGDTVTVPAGVHRERLVIARRVHLEGRPGAIIDGGGVGTVVRVEADGVELRNLSLRGSGDSYLTEDAAVRLQRASGVRLENLRIEDALFGVFAVQANGCAIERSTIIGKDLPIDRRGDGVRLWASNGCRLIGNRVEKSRDLIIWYSSDTLVEDNVVRLGRYGLHYMYSDRNRFRRNRFEDNQVGATIMYSRGVELTQNSFSFARGATGYGLLVKDADDIFIEENRFIDNTTGLFIDGAPQSKGGRVQVHKNLIARNDVGLSLEPRNRGIEIWENSFIGNAAQVQVVGSGGSDGNVWAVAGRGNHWSDAVVYDRDQSGISSIPHRIITSYEALGERAPTLAFFAGTPAAEAIDLAARLFPIFAPRERALDPLPLVRPMLTPWLRGDAQGGGRGLLAAGLILMAALAIFGLTFRRTSWAR